MFLHRLKALKNEPDKLLDFPLEANEQNAAVTTEDIKKLREAFEKGGSKRDLLIFELLLNTGIKVSELCGIDITRDIDSALESLTIRKGDDHRIIPLNSRAKGALVDYIKERGTKPENNLIYGPLGPMKRTAIFKVLTKNAARAGITGMNPNALRELFERSLLEKGLPRPQVGYLLGITKYNVGVTINGEDLERIKKVLDELYGEGK